MSVLEGVGHADSCRKAGEPVSGLVDVRRPVRPSLIEDASASSSIDRRDLTGAHAVWRWRVAAFIVLAEGKDCPIV